MRVAADRWLITLLLPVTALALYVILGEPAVLTVSLQQTSAAAGELETRPTARARVNFGRMAGPASGEGSR